MICQQWEERIALYVGRDLPEWESIAVRDHLADCPACRALLAELECDHAALSELAQEEIPGVRTAVMARVRGERRRMVPMWAWAVAAIAATLLLLIVNQVGPRHALSTKNAPVRVAETGHGPVVRAAIQQAPIKHGRRRRRRPPVAIAKAEPMTVKLLTDDPNVVIYWIFDGKGDE